MNYGLLRNDIGAPGRHGFGGLSDTPDTTQPIDAGNIATINVQGQPLTVWEEVTDWLTGANGKYIVMGVLGVGALLAVMAVRKR